MYGIRPKGNDDPFITNPAEAMEGFTAGVIPGNFFVDMLPCLKYVPDWMPGTGWKKFGKYYRQKNWESRVLPYNHVQQQMVGPRVGSQPIFYASDATVYHLGTRHCTLKCPELHD